MRGQENEKRNQREGKVNVDNDDQLAPGSSTSSSNQQIRSRITVVCAECKRLKLKCDRRTPCGSCTKRDTVARCIYSTAAAEKVDLHSLNNRLMQVESILSMVTSGQAPPPFQSSYPLAQVALPSSRSRQARSKAPLMSPVSILLDDHKNIWLSNNHYLQGYDDEPSSGGSIKLESSGIDNLIKLQDTNMDSTDKELPRGPKPQAGAKLPPLHTYYASSGSSTSSDFQSWTIPVALDTLFSFLPPTASRKKHVCSAANADPSLTMLTDWKSLTRAAEFSTRNPSSRSQATEGVSIPTFATLIYVVAIGIMEGPDRDPHSANIAAQLDELGCQALQVCKGYVLDRGAFCGENSADGLNFVVATLFQLKFRIVNLRQECGPKTGSTDFLFPLIGQLVNLARSFGLAKEPNGCDDDVALVRRLIWWQVMFYDSFISDALNQPALITLSSYNTAIPALEMPEIRVDAFADSGLSDGDEPDNDPTPPTRCVNYHCFCGLHGKRLSQDVAFAALRERSQAGLYAELRLTQLLQVLRQALSHDNCVCCLSNHGVGYTLDQATEVEAEIRGFLDDLPPTLRLHPQLKNEQNRPNWVVALAGMATIMAHRILIASYVPLMRPPPDENTGESSRARTYAAQPWSPPNRATLESAQQIISAAELLRSFNGLDSVSTLMSFHPLNKAVFDAIIITGYTRLGNGIGYAANQVKVACEDVAKALDILPVLGHLSVDMAQIIALIRQRLPQYSSNLGTDNADRVDHGSRLKRKRSHPLALSDSEAQMSPAPESAMVASTPTGSSAGETDVDYPQTSQSLPRTITDMPSSCDSPLPKRDLSKPPPSVGVRNRSKGGPPWAKKLSPRPVSTFNDSTRVTESSIGPIPSRPVSSHSSSLGSANSPHPTDYRYMLQGEPSSVDHRPASAHPQAESVLEERDRQRRRLSYDESAAAAATQIIPADEPRFDQCTGFSNLASNQNPILASLQGNIQGNIQLSRRLDVSEPLYRGQLHVSPDSHPMVDPTFPEMHSAGAAEYADQQFTLNVTGILGPTNDVRLRKNLTQNDTPPLYPGYAIDNNKAFEGSPTLPNSLSSSLLPTDTPTFPLEASSQATVWNSTYNTPPFPLDNRTQFWETNNNYYQ